MIANGDPLEMTITELCVSIQEMLPCVVCTVLTVDRAGLLHSLAAPGMPEEFSQAINGTMIGPDVGSCGTAAYLRTPITVENIATDPKWARYKNLPLAVGLKACWSSPLFDDGHVVGVVALYYRETRGPLESERDIVDVCLDLCRIALKHHKHAIDWERRANVDVLTQLPNRAAFNAALASMPCDEPDAWALFIIDLDNLKIVNDTFGHQAGDALIQAAAQRIQHALSPDVTFRLGGDEFAAIIRDHSALANLQTTAQRIFEALESPARCRGHTIIPKATIGGAKHGRSSENAQTVNQNADFALYHAKETGRGGFVRYWPGIGTSIIHRRDAIRDVAIALEEKRLDAFYQPVVCLDTREIVAVEALCRLRTPSGEIVAAQHFQEATRDAHVAVEWTTRMLSIVAQDVRRWLDDGIPFQHVGVNVSTADFYAGNLLHKLKASFGQMGVGLHHVILEVNEDVYMSQRDRVVAREIALLRESGMRIALDDFGTGYASLTHLLNVPVDVIKIDRSFIARLSPGNPSAAIVESVINIGHKLGMNVIAEGIETENQAAQLHAMGCKLGQGYAFSAALDRKALTALLHQHAQGLETAQPLHSSSVFRKMVPAPMAARTA